MRTVNTAQISYNSAYPTVGYAATLAVMGGTNCAPPSPTGACLIDTQLGIGHEGRIHLHHERRDGHACFDVSDYRCAHFTEPDWRALFLFVCRRSAEIVSDCYRDLRSDDHSVAIGRRDFGRVGFAGFAVRDLRAAFLCADEAGPALLEPMGAGSP